MLDVIIVGAGVCGLATARELSRKKLNIAVLEKNADVGEGISKANSGIAHAGYDAKPGTLMAKLNVRGSRMMEQLSAELDFPYKRNGSLVLCFDEKDLGKLEELKERGEKNRVEGLTILNRQQVLALEPNAGEQVVGALYAPTGAIICPFGLAIALAENAAVNGVEFHLNTRVENIIKEENGYEVITNKGNFKTKAIVNAAGIYSGEIHNMVCEKGEEIYITPRKGEYMLYDKKVGNLVSHTLFQLPTALGKGVLVTPTVHGNLLTGPTAEDIEDKEGTNTSAAGLNTILKKAALSIMQVPAKQVITSFAGLRAHGTRGDFIIEEVKGAKGFFDVAAIESPGLTSAPAIGEYTAAMVNDYLQPQDKDDFVSTRKGIVSMALASDEEKHRLIQENPAYANVICRCEMVTEGEILDAIRRPVGATTTDGIKRRVRAGMGRCQAGFCLPKTIEILARELQVKESEIQKAEKDSYYLLPESEQETGTGEKPEQTNKTVEDVQSNYQAKTDGHLLKTDLAIIGGGPAGMAAAVSAWEKGVTDILILERDNELGGILNQCIHNGFGLHTFQEELTGPEYAIRYIEQIAEKEIPCLLNTMVVDVKGGEPCRITAMNRDRGLFKVEAKAVVLAMGCRERSRGAMNIPGFRPAGIYSAGTAQRFVNREGRMPGKEVVVLGSGDIGLIMARRMSLQGAKVKMVAEIMPYSGGLKRNIVQCLDDFGIPLKLSHTVTEIHGKDRIEGVTVSKVDENLQPIKGSEEYVSCDTLLLSCGLIPENELSEAAGARMDSMTQGPVVNARLQTTAEGIFACGNVLHVHDLVDNVSKEAAEAGAYAAAFVKERNSDFGEAVRPKIPEKSKSVLPEGRDASKTLICIGCPKGCLITVDKALDGSLTITGNTCKKGEEYARNEVTAPKRAVTSIIKVKNGDSRVVSVKTKGEVPKDKIFACMEEINAAEVSAPVKPGDILIANVAGTGIDVVATAGA